MRKKQRKAWKLVAAAAADLIPCLSCSPPPLPPPKQVHPSKNDQKGRFANIFLAFFPIWRPPPVVSQTCLLINFFFLTFIVEYRTNSDLPPPPSPLPAAMKYARKCGVGGGGYTYTHTHTQSAGNGKWREGPRQKKRERNKCRDGNLSGGKKKSHGEKKVPKRGAFRLCVFHKANQTASAKKKHNTPSLLDREATSREREGPSHTHTHTHTRERPFVSFFRQSFFSGNAGLRLSPGFFLRAWLSTLFHQMSGGEKKNEINF